MSVSQWFSDIGLVRKAVLETLRGNSFQVTEEKETANNGSVDIQVLVNYCKAPKGIRDQSNNTLFAINYVYYKLHY